MNFLQYHRLALSLFSTYSRLSILSSTHFLFQDGIMFHIVCDFRIQLNAHQEFSMAYHDYHNFSYHLYPKQKYETLKIKTFIFYRLSSLWFSLRFFALLCMKKVYLDYRCCCKTSFFESLAPTIYYFSIQRL